MTVDAPECQKNDVILCVTVDDPEWPENDVFWVTVNAPECQKNDVILRVTVYDPECQENDVILSDSGWSWVSREWCNSEWQWMLVSVKRMM